MAQDKDLKIVKILQKVFLLGFLSGKGQMEDDMAQSATPIGQTLSDLQAKLESLVPGSTMAGDFNSIINGMEIQKSERPHLTQHQKGVMVQHDTLIEKILKELKQESETLKIEALNEIDRWKDPK